MMLWSLEKVLAIGSLLVLLSCGDDKASVNFQASNALDEVRQDAALIITEQKILDKLSASVSPALAIKGEEGAHYFLGQLDDLNLSSIS